MRVQVVIDDGVHETIVITVEDGDTKMDVTNKVGLYMVDSREPWEDPVSSFEKVMSDLFEALEIQ